MNLKNLIMWAIIVLLSVGLFNMFQDPKKMNSEKNNLPFSNFLNEVDAGRVVETIEFPAVSITVPIVKLSTVKPSDVFPAATVYVPVITVPAVSAVNTTATPVSNVTVIVFPF